MENEKTSKTVSIKIKAPEPKNGIASIARPGDISLNLSNNETLGMVQSFNINASIGTFPTVQITTIISNLEADFLQEKTELVISDSRKEMYLYNLEEILLKMCEDFIKYKKEELFNYIQYIYEKLNSTFNNYGDLLYKYFDKKYNYEYFFQRDDLLKRLNIKLSVSSVLEERIKQQEEKNKRENGKTLLDKIKNI